MKRHSRLCLVTAVLVALAAASPAVEAAFIPIALPGDALPGGGTYLTGTFNIPIPGSEFDVVNSVSDGFQTVDFSIEMMVLDVGSGWATWSSPPFSETDAPRVLYSQGPSQATLTLSQPSLTFGFELEPDQFGAVDFTATFFNGVDEIGSILQSVDGDSGARLFAASVTGGTPLITSVRISSGGQAFAIAQLRYDPSGVNPIPEPGTLTLFAVGALSLIVLRWRKR